MYNWFVKQVKQYKGVVITESLTDPGVIRGLTVLEEEYDEESDWHLVTVEASEDQIEALAEQIKDGPWYIHFWSGDDVLVVFQNRVFSMKHSDKKTWQPVLKYGQSIGIPPEQLDFPIDE